uniref:Chromosome 11 open reading frame 52 n=1 Tax=Ursus americanus TaxID=9643 RepID=A0A452RW73_URSAM
MHQPLYVEKQLGSLGDRAPWETGRAAGEAGSQARRTLKQPQPQPQNGVKARDTRGHIYEQVLEKPTSQERSQGLRREESSLHYADIQVCSSTQPRSALDVKHKQLENATQYATLRFPQATPRYDSKNGTLV